ncbi:DUF4433 domain-containing protein [Orrella daihaiensis]|uniref:DUF4433 domain-containing protein n=1 Tax=Orrella daihaiensis TaxID=2782176 RepID=A0ABY4AU61_9BURK|nr:DUF4433 domain-containing protein [Orrella daihaiensis]
MLVPHAPKIFHIVHVDRLASIVSDGYLWCDARMTKRNGMGTVIGMPTIKRRRLTELTLRSHPGLRVGQCVPFYFCAKSVMLYLLHRANQPNLIYRGGQEPILHLQADLELAVKWADSNKKRWAFTLSNAGAAYFEDRAHLSALSELDWKSIATNFWGGPRVDRSVKERKQAEFLVEECFPWALVQRIVVQNRRTYGLVVSVLDRTAHRPKVDIKPDWYY